MKTQTKLHTRPCINCTRPSSRGMFCRSCDAVWLIAERLDNFHKDPKSRQNFISDLRKSNLFTPKAIWKDGEARKVKKLMILGEQMSGFVMGFTSAEIRDLVVRGYNLSIRNAEREEKHAEAQQTAYYAGRQEVDALHSQIREQTRAKLGHLGDGLDFRSYLGFDPTKTDTDDSPNF
jgi:hypothetical protein